MTLPLDGSEAGSDLVLIQTSLPLLCKSSCSNANLVIYVTNTERSVLKQGPPSLAGMGRLVVYTLSNNPFLKIKILWACIQICFRQVTIAVVDVVVDPLKTFLSQINKHGSGEIRE